MMPLIILFAAIVMRIRDGYVDDVAFWVICTFLLISSLKIFWDADKEEEA
jgi:hypothetical protein